MSTKEVAVAISKWMTDPKVTLPIQKRQLNLLAAYKAAGFRTVVYCKGALDLVHLTRGPAKFRTGDITREGGDIHNDIPLFIDKAGKIITVGPDCDECPDSRLQPKRSKTTPSRRNNATPKKVALSFYVTSLRGV